MASIKVIQNLPIPEKPKRVAAYARVSSDKDAMLHSLSNQVSYYSKLIQSTNGWTFAGVYADEGITGTSDKRDEFNRLVVDAKSGKIDLIITKSISRFARNTYTLLQTARELKSIGVDIYFEEQNLHSISSEGEMVLTLLASVAQEESRQVSDNQKWRIVRDFEKGIPRGGKNCYGYRFVNMQYTVVSDEAEIVRKIFEWYLQGLGGYAIARRLNDEGKRTYYGKAWNPHGVMGILSNITYTGNLLLQKTYRVDHLSKKTKRNKGERQQYFVEDNHEPIITMQMFEEVCRIRKERSAVYNKKESTPKGYPLSGILICDSCGKPYRHKTTNGRTYWICSTFNSQGKAFCAAKQIPENIVYATINSVMGYKSFQEKDFRAKVKRIMVKAGNVLTFLFSDGTEKDAVWKDPSRKDSWTDEMREKARQCALKRNGNGGNQ